MTSKFEVFKDKSGEWRFRLKARNNKIIATSEGYTSKRNAVIGINSVIECAPDSAIIYLD